MAEPSHALVVVPRHSEMSTFTWRNLPGTDDISTGKPDQPWFKAFGDSGRSSTFGFERWDTDKPSSKGHNFTMSEISREELDAKLDATNAKVDARLASFENTVRETLAAIRQDSSEVRGEVKAIHVELGYLRNIKGSIWGAAGATVIGIGSVVATMLSFGVASYDTARENTVLVSESKAQILDSQQKVNQALAAIASQLAESKKQSEETQKVLEQVKAGIPKGADFNPQPKSSNKG